jgi:hypothetical protein
VGDGAMMSVVESEFSVPSLNIPTDCTNGFLRGT